MTNTITKITYDGNDYKVGEGYTAGTGISISASNEISNSGVTSVNGSTGAVTISEFSAANGGVKVFDVPSVNDDISGMLNWIISGGCCILKDSLDYYYTLQAWDGATELLFQCPNVTGPNICYVSITYDNSNIVTQVDSDFVAIKEFNPGGTATIGDVVTKTASGYEWSAPSGGSSTITVTLAAASWSSQSITVSATGVTASNTVIVSPAPANINDYATNSVYCSAQGSGTLTFGCNTEPTVDIDVNVLITN